jgi:DNA-binding NarL/FixJ family response regulator
MNSKPAHPQEAVRATSGLITLLLVDDSPVFLKAVARFLEEQCGGEVLIAGTASDGVEGLRQAQALHPHVVVLDLRMPGMSGLDVIPKLRATLPDVRIIVLTQLEGDEYRHAALARGADAFVAKTTMEHDLPAAIRQVVGGRGSGHNEPPVGT